MIYSRHGSLVVTSFFLSLFCLCRSASLHCEQNAPRCRESSFIQLSLARTPKSFTADSSWHEFDFDTKDFPENGPALAPQASKPQGLQEDFGTSGPQDLQQEIGDQAGWPDPKLDFGEAFDFDSSTANSARRDSFSDFPADSVGPMMDVNKNAEALLESDASMLKRSQQNLDLARYILQTLGPNDKASLAGEPRIASDGQFGPVWQVEGKNDKWPPKLSHKDRNRFPITTDPSLNSSLAQRLLTPMVQAVDYVAGSASGIIEGGSLVWVALVMLASSGVAMFALGHANAARRQDQGNDPYPPATNEHWFSRPSAGGGTLRTAKHRTPDGHGRYVPDARSSARTHGAAHHHEALLNSHQADFTPWSDPLPASHYLCSGLVVPCKSECILAVRTWAGATCSCVVRDLAGQPALHMEVNTKGSQVEGGLDQQAAVTLRANSGGEASKLLAYCKIERASSGRSNSRARAYVYGSSGSLYATLSARTQPGEGLQYVLANARGSIRLSLEGDFKQHAVNIWSESRLLFGDSSPACVPSFDTEGDYWQLRVLANMDVCLLLAALLCAEIIEGSSDK